MERVVLVSNRVCRFSRCSEAGGVSVALRDTLRFHRGDWFGWNGRIDTALTPATLEDEEDGSRIFTLSLSPSEHRDYYLGYSNSVLWPVLHNRLDLAQFEAGYYSGYMNVSRRLAEAIANQIGKNDILWVHDFHLVPLGRELRRLGVENPIGFFLHVPVAPAQTMVALPEHQEIASALSYYDLIGVQTEPDVRNLIDFFQYSVAGRILTAGTIKVLERAIEVARFPVGIDVSSFLASGDSPPVSGKSPLRIVGVDRLDYTKGLPQKFRAFDRFLKEHSEFHGHVTLSQLAPPTRESVEAYADIRAELEALAGAVNGRYSQLDWVPINYIHRPLPRSQLVSLYNSSRVGWVTPLRDGMNLVAKEYVAAQDPSDPGVLVLSKFAGAAGQLTEALLVNPFDPDDMKSALLRAIEMPRSERCRRHTALFDAVKTSDSRAWSDSFIDRLKRVGRSRRNGIAPIPTPIKKVLEHLGLRHAPTSTVGQSLSPEKLSKPSGSCPSCSAPKD